MERLIVLHKKIGAGLLAFGLMFVCLTMVACDGSIYDYEGDCSITYRVEFRYDWNMKYADAFAHEVESVTLYVLDEAGNIVWQRTEAGEALAADDYAMTVDVEPGTYNLLAWCGTTDIGSFVIPDAATRDGLTCTMNREHGTADGKAFVREDLDRLFHGYLENQVFADTEGVYTVTMPLKKDTNNIRVVLAHMSGDSDSEELDASKFEFTITDTNGAMNWDNSLLADEKITYHAWHVDSGYAEYEKGQASESESTRTASRYSVAVAELTVPRLMMQNKETAFLTVRNTDTGDTVLQIRLIDALLLFKGYYNRQMTDQEYLDRQDEYPLTFFLDEGYRWSDAKIWINSWMRVYQEVGLGSKR